MHGTRIRWCALYISEVVHNYESTHPSRTMQWTSVCLWNRLKMFDVSVLNWKKKNRSCTLHHLDAVPTFEATLIRGLHLLFAVVILAVSMYSFLYFFFVSRHGKKLLVKHLSRWASPQGHCTCLGATASFATVPAGRNLPILHGHKNKSQQNSLVIKARSASVS